MEEEQIVTLLPLEGQGHHRQEVGPIINEIFNFFPRSHSIYITSFHICSNSLLNYETGRPQGGNPYQQGNAPQGTPSYSGVVTPLPPPPPPPPIIYPHYGLVINFFALFNLGIISHSGI